jgi:uncharacterized membrane protein YGL010W
VSIIVLGCGKEVAGAVFVCVSKISFSLAFSSSIDLVQDSSVAVFDIHFSYWSDIDINFLVVCWTDSRSLLA